MSSHPEVETGPPAVATLRSEVASRPAELIRSRRSDRLDDVLPSLVDAMVEAIDVAIVVTDLDGRVELWNRAAEEMYGWSAIEAIGQLGTDLVVPVSGLEAANAIWAGLSTSGRWTGEFVCRRRNGSLVPVSVVNLVARTDAGVPQAIVGVSRDITDQLVAQREADSLKVMTDSSIDAVFIGDGTVITSWSAAAERLLGWTSTEATTLSVSSMVPDDRIQESQAMWERVRRGEPVESTTTERLAKHGSTVSVTLTIAPVFDAISQTWRGVVTMRDARSVDAVIEAAMAAEAIYRSLLAQSTEIVVVLDAAGTLRAISPSVKRVLGFTPEQLLGSVNDVLIHPDDRARVKVALDLSISGELDHPEVMYRRRDVNGAWRWGQATLTNMLDHPVIAGIVVNVRDVDEREEALARLSAIVNRSSDVALLIDESGTICWVSPAITEVLGVRPDALEGLNGFDLIHPDDRNRVVTELLDGLALAGSHIQIEFRMVDQSGVVRWVEEVATNLLDDPSVGYIVANLRDITARRLADERLARLALVDDLTDLPNRNALLDLIGATLAEAEPCALMFFDIDDFCDVNDALGHSAGDELLQQVARRVAEQLDERCTLSRFGGDQFAVFCAGVADLSDALALSSMVRTALITPFVICSTEVFAAVSIGVALNPVSSAEALVRRADTALYKAKWAGRSQTVAFEETLGTASESRLHSATELRYALANGSIEPHYQPVIDLATGRVVAVEALARWDHPVHGRIPPDVFIPVAESTGLIAELGTQILERACRDAAAWNQHGRRLQVAVNASADQIMNPAFPDVVSAALLEAHLDPEQITIEITETAALRDITIASQTLTALGERGVLVALDDFGTGYSSLSFLQRLTVGTLKIDQTFVAGLGKSVSDDQIVTGVIGLGLALGYLLVGEGVETADQARLLRDLGCQFGQGYLWSPAVPAGELLDTIERIEQWSVTQPEPHRPA